MDPRHFTVAPRHFTLDPRHFTLTPRHFTLDPRHFTLDPRPSTKTYTPYICGNPTTLQLFATFERKKNATASLQIYHPTSLALLRASSDETGSSTLPRILVQRSCNILTQQVEHTEVCRLRCVPVRDAIFCPPSPPLSRVKGKETDKPTNRSYFGFFRKPFLRKSINYITFKMRRGNEMGDNPSTPLIENTFLRAHSETFDVNICFQAEDIMAMETLLL